MASIKSGARGPEVTLLQGILTQLGHPELAVDGIFGGATEAAVRSLQQRAGIAVDGKVGPNTAAAIVESLQALGHAPDTSAEMVFSDEEGMTITSES